EVVARLGVPRITFPDKTSWIHFTFSPDGRWLAGRWQGGPQDGWGTCLWDTETLTLRHFEPSVGFNRAFSPDSKYLAVTARATDGRHGLRLLDLTGPTPKVVKEFAHRNEGAIRGI